MNVEGGKANRENNHKETQTVQRPANDIDRSFYRESGRESFRARPVFSATCTVGEQCADAEHSFVWSTRHRHRPLNASMANVEAVASPQGTKRTRDDVEAEDATQNTNAANQDDDGKHATNSHHDRGLSEQLPQCTMLSMLLVPGPVQRA